MWDNPEGGLFDPAVDDRRCCKKNSSVLSCIDKRGQKKAVTGRKSDISVSVQWLIN